MTALFVCAGTIEGDGSSRLREPSRPRGAEFWMPLECRADAPHLAESGEYIARHPHCLPDLLTSCTCFALEASQVRECDYWVLLSQLSRITAGDLRGLGELEGPRYLDHGEVSPRPEPVANIRS